MTQAKLIHYMTLNHVNNMGAKDMYLMCKTLNMETPMSMIIEALEMCLRDEIDEVDYDKIPEPS